MKNKAKTALSKVWIEAEVARRIRQHARSSMKTEVCGVLIGREEGDSTFIEACIPGVNAAQAGTHVTFTQETWEHIYKIKDKDHPDDRIVGWYHSHPGFGVFLSDHDMFIQENFFSSPNQVAWVYDPHSDEEGCFGWQEDKIEKIHDVRLQYRVPLGETKSVEEEQDVVVIKKEEKKGNAGIADLLTTGFLYAAIFALGGIATFFFISQDLQTTPGKVVQLRDSVLLHKEDFRNLMIAHDTLREIDRRMRERNDQQMLNQMQQLQENQGKRPAAPAPSQGGKSGSK